jgi:hypothetical protein
MVYHFRYVLLPKSERSTGIRAVQSAPVQRRDIVAKDLIAFPIVLSLYFTIFLNKLDNLFAYTDHGTIRPRFGLVCASFSWLG